MTRVRCAGYLARTTERIANEIEIATTNETVTVQRVLVVAKERDMEIIGPVLGKDMACRRKPSSLEHAQDPTLVLFVLQARVVWA
ncbi:hypothetical protein BD311DRAFT_868999 [Dichomitus squalens]|uniref:Uncharacterized protein n=1 Tax=Dichomitus squalens TaxID=114155 RepID=A0A4Q9M7T5_9APHY|nr:hypothetical protein BD311DRAFT_868999 [Dichomitus squalens]